MWLELRMLFEKAFAILEGGEEDEKKDRQPVQFQMMCELVFKYLGGVC